jgi:thiol:disulfide interchange protein
MDNNNLNETPVVEEVQDVQETVEQAEQVTYSYAADAEEAVAEGGSKGLSIAGLIIGIASLLCCAIPCLNCVLGIVGLVLSIIAKKKKAGGPATGGLITSIIGIVGAFIVIIVWFVIIIINIVKATQ